MTRRLLAVLLGALLGLLMLAGPAAAHTELATSDPANGAELDAVPPVITLTFSEDLQGETATVGVLVQGQDPVQVEAPIAGPTVSIDTAVPALAAAGPGTWAIAYQVVSGDGHPVTGTLTFAVTGASASATAGSGAAAGSDGAAAGSDSAEPATGGSAESGQTAERAPSGSDGDTELVATADETGQDEAMSPLLWLVTVAVIGLVVLVVVKTERWRRKKAAAQANGAAEPTDGA